MNLPAIRSQLHVIKIAAGLIRAGVGNGEALRELDAAQARLEMLTSEDEERKLDRMTNFDRILQIIGALAMGTVVTSQSATDGIPKGVVIVASVVTFAVGLVAKPVLGGKTPPAEKP